MIFQPYPPSPSLQSFVQCYLEADCRNIKEAGKNVLFPNGLSGIFFNFGDAGKLIIKEEYKTPAVSIFGQIDRYFTITHLPGFYSLGVMLQPTVLSHLFRVDMSAFTNKAFDGQLLCSEMKPLHEQMAEAIHVKQKIELIEAYLTARLKQLPQLTLADEALHLIHHYGITSVEQLARQLRVSDRHLETQFKTKIGLSPKTYSLIHRFKRMEQQVIKLPSIQWQQMEFANEYYDQNHFIKDFKRFTGLTPSRYLLEKLDMGRSYLKA